MRSYGEFAHIYDELIHEDIQYKEWSTVILDLCKVHNVKMEQYLDLACGTGNITIELGKSFKHTWAVDLSEEMLVEAEEKAREQRLKARFICQDISELQLNRKFDLITCCLDSTNYIIKTEQLKGYFQGVYEHLGEDGLFIFDINSCYKLKQVLGNNTFTYEQEDVVYIWQNSVEDDVVDMYLTFFIREGEVYRRFDEEHSERAYTEEYIESILDDTGFKVIEKMDNYYHKTIQKKTERIVYVVKK